MRQIDWKNALVYALFTGLAALVFYWFFGLFAERLGSIEWAILISATLAAAALIIFLALRWYAVSRIRSLIANNLPKFKQLEEIANVAGPQAVTRDDLQGIYREMRALTPSFFKLGGIILTIAMLITLLGEIVLLANAAVLYLQAERLKQQNILISNQTYVIEESFLVNSIPTIDSIIAQNNVVRSATLKISRDVESTLSILPEFLSSMMKSEFSDQRIFVNGYSIVVCDDLAPASCDDLPIEQLSALATGALPVNEDNRAALRAYVALTRTLAFVVLPMIADFSDNDSINAGIDAFANVLDEAAIACSLSSADRTQIAELWLGLSGASLAATEMWPPDVDAMIENGGTIVFGDINAQANFLGLAAAGGALRQTLGDEFETVAEGAQSYSEIISRALTAFDDSIEDFSTSCTARAAELNSAITALNSRRDEILSRILEQTAAASNDDATE